MPKGNDWNLIVASEGWGGAPARDITQVVKSAANEFLRYWPDRPACNLLIEGNNGSPITLYERRDGDTIVIQLNVKGTYWAQFAYQFSHELCHVLCNYERGKPGEEPNKWFEETLAETASLFALNRLAVTWRTAPPYPNWAAYAPSLASYVKEWRAQPERWLPTDTTLSQWFEKNQAAMRANATNREKNAVVANCLLSQFEAYPQGWDAVRYLNLGRADRSKSFPTYLREWYEKCPGKHKGFVKQIAQQFAVSL